MRNSEGDKNTLMLPGSVPAGRYWFTPLTVAVILAGLTATLWLLQLGQYYPQVAPIPWVVALGSSEGLLLLGSIIQAVRQRQWDAQQIQRSLAALESLTRLSEAVSAEGGGEAEVLARLPQAIGTLLGMKMSCVSILEEDGQTLRVVARVGLGQLGENRRLTLDESPTSRQCIRTRSVVAIDDALHPRNTNVNKDLAKQMGVRAIVQIPMFFKGEVIGIIMLGDDQPHHFSEVDKRMAWLWGGQAAVTLSNCRLYAQTNEALADQKRLMDQRMALYPLNTAIHQPGTLEEILQRITELSPEVMEVDAVTVTLVADDNPEQMILSAATPPYDKIVVGHRYGLSGTISEDVFSSKRMLVIEETVGYPKMVSFLRDNLPARSMMFEPMFRADGRPMGILAMMRKTSGPFRPEQLDLAHLFSVRAASAIETSRLYQQTRRDADTKVMLLRELNHRVKNNLSAIVSLLSIERPEMRAEEAQWLGRVTDRIVAMSQAHELISGKLVGVTLGELIQQTVKSLSVAKPPDVSVLTEVGAGVDCLRSDRAISLAMALHELCFNGITHGLHGRGTLTIRASRNNGELVIDVADNNGTDRPAVIPTLAHSPRGRGVGLNLVRGLVSRELRGQFALSPAVGGAVATVRFPLLPDEMRTDPV